MMDNDFKLIFLCRFKNLIHIIFLCSSYYKKGCCRMSTRQEYQECLEMKILLLFIFLLLGIRFCSAADNKDNKVTYPNVRPFGYTHLWAVNDRTPGPAYGDDYQIARARVGVKGYLTHHTDYMVLTEWGRLTYNDPVTLLDVWVNYKVNPGFNIKVGQTWYKFTLSGSAPLPTIPFIARPEVIDAIWLPMGRNGSYSYDKGIELWGDFRKTELSWGYVFSVTAGSGLDQFENNGKKDFTGRLYIEPIKDLKLGLSGFYGWSQTEITSNLNTEEKKDLPEYAYGVDISYNHKYFRIITEALQALYEGHIETNGAETFSLVTKKQRGWYAMVGFKPLSWIEIPVQYAWHESNYVNSDTGLRTITVGLTWFLKEKTLNNVKINYLIRSAQRNYGSKPRNKFMVQVQLAF